MTYLRDNNLYIYIGLYIPGVYAMLMERKSFCIAFRGKMSRDHRRFHESTIQKNRHEIQRKINPRAVLDHMGDSVSDVDRQQITQACLHNGDIMGAGKLVDVLLRSYAETFVKFVEAVVKAGSGGQILARELCRGIPSCFKGRFSHIFPGIEDEQSDEDSASSDAEEQVSRAGEPCAGLLTGENFHMHVCQLRGKSHYFSVLCIYGL